MATLFTFLILAFMAYVAFNVLRIIYHVRREINKMRSNIDNQQQADNADSKKKFSKNVGDYVDYEEVPDDGTPASDTVHRETAADQYAAQHRQDRVSDAEYEEID